MKTSARLKTVIPAGRLAARVAAMGRSITRDTRGRRLDVVVILENAFLFAADLVRHIGAPVTCHFVRVEMRDVKLGGFDRREIFFSHEPDLEGRDVLIVDTVLHTGVTLDFLAKRLLQSRPRTLRVAVLVDRPQERRVDLRPDYFGFQMASKQIAGYGLADSRGESRNLPYIASLAGTAPARPRAAGRGRRPGRRKSGR